jgi:hypothetical protein
MALTLYVGLGPKGVNLDEATILQKLQEVCPILSIRKRGTCAFVDVESQADADTLITDLTGQYIGECRLAIRAEKGEDGGRGGGGRGGAETALSNTVFVGLGPKGVELDERLIVQKIQEVCPVVAIRKSPTFALVDLRSTDDATRVINQLTGQYVGECRLAIRADRGDNGGRVGGGGGRGGYGGGDRAGAGSAQSNTVFIGLGPKGVDLDERLIVQKIQEVCPVVAIRKRGTSALVDVRSPADADRLINQLTGQYIGECRLAIRADRGEGGGRGGGRGNGGRGGFGDRGGYAPRGGGGYRPSY